MPRILRRNTAEIILLLKTKNSFFQKRLDMRCKRLYNLEVVWRDVAQFGSALRSGRRGRRFKSCHPDHEKSVLKISVRFFQRYKFLPEFAIYLRCDISSMRYVAFGNEKKDFISYRNETKFRYIEFARQIYRTSASEYIAKKFFKISMVWLSQKKPPGRLY